MVVAGEVRSDAYVDVQGVARRVINRIGYTKSEYQFDCNSCGILSAIHEQSSDINQGVVRAAEEDQGAGDQGTSIFFGKTRFRMIDTTNATATTFAENTDCTISGKICHKSISLAAVKPTPTAKDNAAMVTFL